jgi:two-component system sensor histidine kinase MprB
MSYRRRLMLLAAFAVSLAVVLASVVTYVSVRTQLRGSVDEGLRALADRVATAPVPQTGEPAQRRPNLDEQRRRSFLLLLPSSPLGEQAGYAQVVSSAGNIQPPEGQRARLAAGPRVIAVAQGRAAPFFYDSELSGTKVRVYVARFAEGQALQAARSLEETNATMRKLLAVLVGVSLAGIGLAALLGGWVGRSALRPVRRLMRGTRYVAATQDLSRRVDAVGDDELAGLARSFNSMLDSLAESRRAQRQLIADASHELRTPLTTVQANVELLSRANELPPDERRQLREDLLSQLRELTALVGDLVELAREHPPESDLEELELDEIVAGCVERIRARGSRVRFRAVLSPTRVRGDRVRLERAVMNLLDNARK